MTNKIYLLIDNLDYYPGVGTADWIGMYSTKALAEATMQAQREAQLAENLTVVEIDIEDLTWKEVAYATAI